MPIIEMNSGYANSTIDGPGDARLSHTCAIGERFDPERFGSVADSTLHHARENNVNNILRKTGFAILIGSAIAVSSSAFAQEDQKQMELIESVKSEFADLPGVIGGFQDGVVTLSGQMDDVRVFEKLKRDLMNIDGVEDVRSTVTYK